MAAEAGGEPRGYSWVPSTILSQGILRADLRGVPYVLHGTIDRFLPLFAYLFGGNLESCPDESVWEEPYCPRFRQLPVGGIGVIGTHDRDCIDFLGTRVTPLHALLRDSHPETGRRLT